MKIKVLFGIGISLLFIYLALWKPDFGVIFSGAVLTGFFGSSRIDVREMLEALQKANYLFILLIIVLIYFGWWIRAWRWQILAAPIKKVSAKLSFNALMIGYLGNTVLPLRAGEFMRSYIAAKRTGMPFSSALALVVVERVLDLVMLLMAFTLSLLLFPLPGDFKRAGIVILFATILLVAFLTLLLVRKEKALALAAFMLKILPENFRQKILKIIADFSDGLGIFRSSERYLMVIFWTVFMWGIYLAIIFVSFYILGFMDPGCPMILNSPFVATVVILTITTAGIGIPSAPGAVGTYHGMCSFGVQLFQVDPSTAMTYAVLMHLTNFFPMTIIGLISLFSEGFKLAELSGLAQKRDLSADPD